MPVELIMFDLDGTLVDSSVDLMHAVNYAFRPYQVLSVTVQETIDLVGEGITRLIEKLVDRYSAEALQTAAGASLGSSPSNFDRDLVQQRFLEHYSAHLVDNTFLYPGVRETLHALKGTKKAVISNKREALSVAILQQLGVFVCFDFVAGSDTLPERKPSPVPVTAVLERLGVLPGRALIVGDSNFDIQAGKAAGVSTVGVTYGFRRLSYIRDADFIINQMPELVELIGRLD